MIPNFKSLLLAGVAILVAALYFYASNQLQKRDQKNFDAGVTSCQLLETKKIIEYKNIYVKENIKTRAATISDKFDFLRSECTDCASGS